MSEEKATAILAKHAPNWRQNLWQDDVLLCRLILNLKVPELERILTGMRDKNLAGSYAY